MINTVIFDMDGVIIDSEPLWQKAEKVVFSSLGVPVSEELSQLTATMTTKEVTKFWYALHPWSDKSLDEAENEVVNLVERLIVSEGQPIKGIKDLLSFFKEKEYKIGLATNSPFRLIAGILDKADVTNYFDAISSAEDELHGKPNPAVYLSTAQKLNASPHSCLVFEDSVSGIKAAKAAEMTAVAMVSPEEKNDSKFNIADLIIESFDEFTNEELSRLSRKVSL